MTPVQLELDLSKEPGEVQAVWIRQGEANATTLRAHVTDGGAEVDLSAYDVYFEMRHPGGALLEDDVTEVDGSTLTYTVAAQAAQEVGTTTVAYFSLKNRGSTLDAPATTYATTQAFGVVILPNAQGDRNAVAKAYVSEIERLLKWCKDTFDENEAKRQEASDAAVKRANDAADAVEKGIDGITDPLFDNYMSRHKDVPGGVVSWETFSDKVKFMTDEQFVEFMRGGA